MKALYRKDVEKNVVGNGLDSIKTQMDKLIKKLDFSDTTKSLQGEGYNAIRESIIHASTAISAYNKDLVDASDSCESANNSMASFLNSCKADVVDDKYKEEIDRKYNLANNRLNHLNHLYNQAPEMSNNFLPAIREAEKDLKMLSLLKSRVENLEQRDNKEYNGLVDELTKKNNPEKIRLPRISKLFDNVDFTDFTLKGLKRFSKIYFSSLDNFDYYKNMPEMSKRIIAAAFSYYGKKIKYKQSWRTKTKDGILFLDCSSFVSFVYRDVFPDDFGLYFKNKNLPTVEVLNRNLGASSGLSIVSRKHNGKFDTKPLPGDLLLTCNGNDEEGHVVIYLGSLDIGDGKKNYYIHCTSGNGGGVMVMNSSNFAKYDTIVRHVEEDSSGNNTSPFIEISYQNNN